MSIRHRATAPRVEGTPKLANVTEGHSGRSSKTLQTLWKSWWIRAAFIVTCATTLLTWRHWTRVVVQLPHQPVSPEPDNSNDNDPPFILRHLPGRGIGAVAIRDIRRGELLLRERPLLFIPRENLTSLAQSVLDLVQLLSPDQAASFYNLSHAGLREDLSPEVLSNSLPLAIFRTNAVALRSDAGLFPMMARLNHGCSGAFNSVYSWREREGVLVIYALKDIKSGEELLTSYLGTRQTRDERRRHLKHVYDFHCMCSYCTLPDEKSKASDIRLTVMNHLYQRLGTWGNVTIDGQEAIRLVKQIWTVGDEEGYTAKRGRLAADAMIIASAHFDAEAAVEWASLALEWASIELGSDSNLAEEMRIARQEPKRHKAWGQRPVMRVGGPSAMMYMTEH